MRRLTASFSPGLLGIIAAVCVAMLFLSGCISTERLAQAEAIAVQASERLADGEQTVETARATLSKAEALADRTGSPAATEAVATARAALSQAEAALPALQLAAQDTAQALTAARKAQEAGGSWWEVLLAAGAALATGGTAGAALMGTRTAKVAHALRSTIAYVDALKPAADAGLGKNERKRLAAQTLDRADIAIIERERAALNVQRIETKAAA